MDLISWLFETARLQHKNIACAPRGAALRLRHQLRDQKGTATASRNKVTSEISKISRRTSGGALNVRAHHRKRAQIFDPLPGDAAIKSSPSQWAASAMGRQALLSPRPRGREQPRRKARSFPKSIPRRFNSSAAREQTGQIAPQRRTSPWRASALSDSTQRTPRAFAVARACLAAMNKCLAQSNRSQGSALWAATRTALQSRRVSGSIFTCLV